MNSPNISYTLHHDLCTGCGICEDACPHGAITTVVKQGRFLPKIDESLCRNRKGCHRCMDSCPGVGVDLVKMTDEFFMNDGTKTDKWAGRYLKCFTGHSNNGDIRYHCASGGGGEGLFRFDWGAAESFEGVVHDALSGYRL